VNRPVDKVFKVSDGEKLRNYYDDFHRNQVEEKKWDFYTGTKRGRLRNFMLHCLIFV